MNFYAFYEIFICPARDPRTQIRGSTRADSRSQIPGSGSNRLVRDQFQNGNSIPKLGIPFLDIVMILDRNLPSMIFDMDPRTVWFANRTEPPGSNTNRFWCVDPWSLIDPLTPPMMLPCIL